MPVDDFTPTVAEVAAIIADRTFVKATLVGSDNNLAGTFTEDTRPTDQQVEDLIKQAATEIAPWVSDNEGTSDGVYGLARVTVSRRAAMLVLISYFSEELEAASSGYDELRQLYLDALEALKGAGGDTNAAARGFYSIPLRSEVADYCGPVDLLP